MNADFVGEARSLAGRMYTRALPLVTQRRPACANVAPHPCGMHDISPLQGLARRLREESRNTLGGLFSGLLGLGAIPRRDAGTRIHPPGPPRFSVAMPK